MLCAGFCCSIDRLVAGGKVSFATNVTQFESCLTLRRFRRGTTSSARIFGIVHLFRASWDVGIV